MDSRWRVWCFVVASGGGGDKKVKGMGNITSFFKPKAVEKSADQPEEETHSREETTSSSTSSSTSIEEKDLILREVKFGINSPQHDAEGRSITVRVSFIQNSRKKK